MKFNFFYQLDARDCGPACLRMVSYFYGNKISFDTLRERCFITKTGVSLLGISEAAESIGFRSTGLKISFDLLKKEASFPCIVYWEKHHFIVLLKIKKSKVIVADPSLGIINYSYEEFLKGFSIAQDGEETGIVLLLEPGSDFYTNIETDQKATTFSYLIKYLKQHKGFVMQLFLGMLLGLILQMIFPFLTQAIVDKGIGNSDVSFIIIILIAQLILNVSRTIIDFIRNWIILHLSTRINISLLSDFLSKLMKLPIGFFESKRLGDLVQRMGDHQRIQVFITGSTINVIFSLLSLLILGIVLLIYDYRIFGIYFLGSTLYFLWIRLFMPQRREIDYKRFGQMTEQQNNIYQTITGMQDIKLNNCEQNKRWKWEYIQARLYKLNIKSLNISQYQQTGALLFSESKNIIIIFFSAYLVIKGEITLGVMMSIQFIIGQLNSPIDQLVNFFQSAQDAKISMERISEVIMKDDEECSTSFKMNELPKTKSIIIRDLSFRYSSQTPIVLKDINFTIPQGKVTAIVGESGGGKTTLMKLILGFYPCTKGGIYIGETSLSDINIRTWRNNCGTVLQDSFIFSDTIEENITISSQFYNKERLYGAIKIANLNNFIESQPLGLNTRIGMEGCGISEGQKQRILIARAVYKNPDFLFFDEATNSLDTRNENIIMSNFTRFFAKKTVLIIAHRLSTIRKADQIVVLKNGSMVEIGSHEELLTNKSYYFELVQGQLMPNIDFKHG
ncbi:MAG: peptidase domain-containing ABC transporter [Alphaproteobacteria bacterium]|nr:peptidase domain-containing ABC transporter [Alphaproteobacteria bacterium]